jgi:hypothetical protein
MVCRVRACLTTCQSSSAVRRCGQILAQVSGTPWLIVSLLYGAGLRLLECLELRVKDLDFDGNQVIVRGGKGRRDRRTVLPVAAKAPLTSHAFQSVPGPANYVVTERAPGVPLVGSATIALLPATGGIAGVGAEYGERLNQLDLRVGKLFRVAGTRTMLNVDFFNLFNGNAVTITPLEFVATSSCFSVDYSPADFFCSNRTSRMFVQPSLCPRAGDSISSL